MGIKKNIMGDASFAGPANTTFIKDIASLWTICIEFNILVEIHDDTVI